MSYDLRIRVKAEGCDAYPVIAVPEHDSPTYNLGKMFRVCMDWDFSQSEPDENGVYKDVYYNCADVMPKIEKGIKELHLYKEKFRKYEPDNGWGTVENAINSLESLRDCIYQTAEEIPIQCLYMTW